MIDISVTGLTLSFGERVVLDNIALTVDSGHRVGLLGKNGCGKTSLLKVLTGEYRPDSGSFAFAPHKRIGLLSQIPDFGATMTGEAVMRTAFEPVNAMAEELKQLELLMQTDHDNALLARYGKLSEAFELADGFHTEVNFAKVKNGLRIADTVLSQPFGKLSGGERTRLNLARLLLQQTEILLLDEPTNHLDLEAVEWLEGFLSAYKGTVLVVSHDRVFLDNVITEVLELDDGHITPYTGNYSQYIAEKNNRRQHQLNVYKQEQRKIKQLLDTARVAHERGTEKQHIIAFALEKRAERIATVDKPKAERQLKATFATRDFKGDELLALEGVGKAYGDQVLFEHVDLLMKGQQRVALLGANGAGKTTLLKMVLGEERGGGRIVQSPSLRMGYLPQLVHFDRPERSMLETLLYDMDFSTQEARDRLGAFGFVGDDVFKPVGKLSGGERSRLKLCMLMCQQVNLLVLDEPTNHLDLPSRHWIEDVLALYDQALLFVSHDRAFIEKFADCVWQLEDKTITAYPMRYEQYKQLRASQSATPATKAATPQAPIAKDRQAQERRDRAAARQLEKQLETLETRLMAIDVEMNEKASDADALVALTTEQAALAAERDSVYEAWFSLCQ